LQANDFIDNPITINENPWIKISMASNNPGNQKLEAGQLSIISIANRIESNPERNDQAQPLNMR